MQKFFSLTIGPTLFINLLTSQLNLKVFKVYVINKNKSGIEAIFILFISVLKLYTLCLQPNIIHKRLKNTL